MNAMMRVVNIVIYDSMNSCKRLFFLMIRQPPRSKRTDTLFPYTTLFRSTIEERSARRAPRHRNWRRPPAAGCGLLPHEAAHVLAAQHRLLDFRTLLFGERHEATLGQVAVRAKGRRANVLLAEPVDVRNHHAKRLC